MTVGIIHSSGKDSDGMLDLAGVRRARDHQHRNDKEAITAKQTLAEELERPMFLLAAARG